MDAITVVDWLQDWEDDFTPNQKTKASQRATIGLRSGCVVDWLGSLSLSSKR